MSEVLSHKTRNRIARGIVSFVIGAGIGFAVESHTDDIARKKIVTVETCKKIAPLVGAVVTPEFQKCITDGVPNRTKIGHNKIKVGQPVAFVDAYESAQHNEQGIELERILLWGAGGVLFEVADVVGDILP